MTNLPNQKPKSKGAQAAPADYAVSLEVEAHDPAIEPLLAHGSQGQNDLFRDFVFVWLAVNCIDSAPRRVRRALKSQEEALTERFVLR